MNLKIVRLFRAGVVLAVFPLAATLGSLNSVAGAAGAGYQGTQPALPGPGGVSFPVVRVIPGSSNGQRANVGVDGVNLYFVIPPGIFAAGDQLVIANAHYSAPVPGRKTIFAFATAEYRNGAFLIGNLRQLYNIVINSPQIELGDRIFQQVRGKWVLCRSFRIVNGKIVVGIGTWGVIEVVGPIMKK